MLNESIERFMQAQKVATICCNDEQGHPYCFNCFYAFDKQSCLLIFKTSATSKHYEWISKNPGIAGTILPNKLNVFAMQGIQFSGVLLPVLEMPQTATRVYYKKFPFALPMSGEICVILLDAIKMTNNAKGFGHKTLWQRTEDMMS